MSDASMVNSASWSYLRQFLRPASASLIYASRHIYRRESNTIPCLDSIFSIPASVKSVSRVYDFSLMFMLLAFCFYRIITLGFLFLAGSGHIDTVLAGFMGEYLDRPAFSIGEHSGSHNFCPRACRVHGRIFEPASLID